MPPGGALLPHDPDDLRANPRHQVEGHILGTERWGGGSCRDATCPLCRARVEEGFGPLAPAVGALGECMQFLLRAGGDGSGRTEFDDGVGRWTASVGHGVLLAGAVGSKG